MEQVSRRTVKLGVDGVQLEGALTLPPGATSVAVLVNGDWGVRFASRERALAGGLRQRGIGTFVIELLTPGKTPDRSARFDTERLARRLAGVVAWLDHDDRTAALVPRVLDVGPGAATALRAITDYGTDVGAVVGLDGRFDLVDDPVEDTSVPTLLLINGDNEHLLELTAGVRAKFGDDRHHCTVLWPNDQEGHTIVTEVASLAADWFDTHLGDAR